MQAGGATAVAVITATIKDDEGDAGAVSGSEDAVIALRDVSLTESHLSEAVIDVDICAGVPKHEVGLGTCHGFLERGGEGCKVGRALDAAW
jgi:hypothetical protein